MISQPVIGLTSISSISSISPSVLKMIKSDKLSLQITANLMFTNLLLASTRPYKSKSSLLFSSLSSSMKLKNSSLYDKIKRIFTITIPLFQFVKDALLAIIAFIKTNLGHKDAEVAKKETIISNQDKDIREGRKWTSKKIIEIEKREGLHEQPKLQPQKNDQFAKVKNSVASRSYSIDDNFKPPLPKRTYSSNKTDSEMEKFWPPARLFNMTNGPGERISRQTVPLLVPKPIKTENETRIQALASEIKALSQDIEQTQAIQIQEVKPTQEVNQIQEFQESKEKEIIDPIAELEETIEAIVDEHIIAKKPQGLLANLTVDIGLSDISLGVIANITQNKLLTEYGIMDLSSKIFTNNTLGIWKLEENRILNGLVCESMFDRIILKNQDQIYCELPGSKGLEWNIDEEKLEMKILRGTSSTEYIRDDAGKLTSVKVIRPPVKGSYDRMPTLVSYKGYLLGDRIIGDVFTSSFAMGNITTEETLSGKFQLLRYTMEEMKAEKRSFEIQQSIRSDIKK